MRWFASGKFVNIHRRILKKNVKNDKKCAPVTYLFLWKRYRPNLIESYPYPHICRLFWFLPSEHKSFLSGKVHWPLAPVKWLRCAIVHLRALNTIFFVLANIHHAAHKNLPVTKAKLPGEGGKNAANPEKRLAAVVSGVPEEIWTPDPTLRSRPDTTSGSGI